MKSIIEKFEGTKLTHRNAMDANYPSSRIAREVYWMKELLTVFRCGVMTEKGINVNQFKRILMLVLYLRFYLQKNRHIRHIKGISKIKPRDFINEAKNMLETNIRKGPNVIGISLSNMKSLCQICPSSFK